jgi:AmmeMemoRadiSam system protein A
MFELTDFDRSCLLQLSRQQLNRIFSLPVGNPVDENMLSGLLHACCGVFVSLHNNQVLRGCIGCLRSQRPLYEMVKEMTISAALHDHRFNPVTRDELNDLLIEISVLTPMRKIESPDELELGKHGIYITDGFRSGTFLPQVAGNTGWSKDEFLGHCSRDKAGLGWNGWKNADVFIYEAFVFSE